jgi:hypothetical protein
LQTAKFKPDKFDFTQETFVAYRSDNISNYECLKLIHLSLPLILQLMSFSEQGKVLGDNSPELSYKQHSLYVGRKSVKGR